MRLPYKQHGERSFNGRTLDEKAINPFLKENRIPSSGGPYLSAFRRSVKFEEATAVGVRDKEGFAAFLSLLGHLEALPTEAERRDFVGYLILEFARLREAGDVALSRLSRMSLNQYDRLLLTLLATRSGGRFSMFVVVATLRAIKSAFGLPWTVEYQGINVADQASGAGGDVTVRRDGESLLVVEVTERPVDENRLVATVNEKILPGGITDYVFLTKEAVSSTGTIPEIQAAYFAQGHEVNFFTIREWVVMILGTIGSKGRARFNDEMRGLLEPADVPRHLKVAWNRAIESLASPLARVTTTFPTPAMPVSEESRETAHGKQAGEPDTGG